MNLTIRIYPVACGLLSKEEWTQVAAWHDAAFSRLPIQDQYEWATGGDFNLLLDVDQTFAGFVGVIKRQVLFDHKKTKIGGIRGLVIDPAWRGKGLGGAIMAEAHKVIFRTLKADFGFLFCLKSLEPFYLSLGWRTLLCPVTVENRAKKVAWSEAAMVLNKGSDFDSASIKAIDLLGKPF
jgi:GNAT superfamily N-acetyltransferase